MGRRLVSELPAYAGILEIVRKTEGQSVYEGHQLSLKEDPENV